MSFSKPLLVICYLLPIISYAQQRYEKPEGDRPVLLHITGQVADEEGAAIPYASAAAYREKDSTLAGADATDSEGRFSIACRPGLYFLKITFLSYHDTVITGIRLMGGDADAGTITLFSSGVSLETTVTEKRPEMELKLDKRVFNISQNPEFKGNNAAEVLDNIPSVSVDVEGNVSLRGNQSVRVLVDGKPSGLTGISTQDALRQLQGSLIDQVEIITNPSARYDAEGEVGIINIILKKDQRKGYNGSIDLTAGYPDNYGASLSANWRKQKVNLFTTYGTSYRKSPGSGSSYQKTTLPDTSWSYDRKREHTRGGFSNNLRAGTDITFNKYNSLSLAGSYSFSNGENEAGLFYTDLDEAGNPISQLVREEVETENTHNAEGDLNYTRSFKQKERKWTFQVKLRNSIDRESSALVETSAGASSNERSENTEDERNILIQSDYVHPLGKEGKIEAGFKGTGRVIDSDYTVEEQMTNEQWAPITGFDNHLVFSEGLLSGYLMAGSKLKKFSMQAGIRAEQSDVATQMLQTSYENNRDYLDLFPSAHFSYEFREKSFVQLSYSRRIHRPQFRMLLPFFSYSDSRNYFSGNPDLDPTYTHSMETSFLRYTDKGSLLASVYYRYSTGVVERITISDTINTRTFPINLSDEQSYGFESNLSRDLTKWLKSDASFNFYRSEKNGSYEGTSLSSDSWAWNARMNVRVKFWKNANFQTSFNYRSPSETTQGRSLASYGINLAMNKDIMAGKGTITISLRDMLNTQKWRSVIDQPGFYSENDFQWMSRQLILNFNYRINQKKRERREGGGFEDFEMVF